MPTLTLEDELMKENIKRLVNRLYDEKDLGGMHEMAHLLLDAMYLHKTAMYYFRDEALDTIT
jgi:hypothetical protein